MKRCLKEEYWDLLVHNCVPCERLCHRPNHKNCDVFCKSLRCSKKQGSYYDHLVKECISCYSICGQHPKQCAHICQSKKSGPERVNVTAAHGQPWIVDSRRAEASPLLQLDQKLSGDPGQLALVYTVLGLCVFAIFCCFFVTMACFLRRKGDQPRPGPDQTSTQDHLMEAGSVGDASKELKTPEPVETSSFSYPEQTPPTEESTVPTEVSHPEVPPQQENVAAMQGCVGLVGTASSGPTPGCKEGCFKIICSPSQEKASSP
ncbi:tumor necrosis factor receptor superfamily member 13B isoform X1 [Phascolarctos cinereus]|uniref:Tumor necrosis factor receptor superfamily member 13B isoform X1 n=1 Tax=Phascolarctos cinereus TaxID=38626 RepID=A0A6P5M384_PHACI|nr:tumor necrosis factor receptor superfamily member 13B isoform X1 [Phascolarctos cinereus]